MRDLARGFDSVRERSRYPERPVGKLGHGQTVEKSGSSPALELALNQVVFRSGSQARFLFLIERGAIRLEAPSSRWYRRAVALLGPGDVIGEECLNEGSYRYDAVAAAASTVLRIDARDPEAVESCLGPLVRTLLRQRHDAEVRHADMQAPAMARLARCLLDLARRLGVEDESGWIILRAMLTQRLLASYIGVSRVTATRMMGELRRRGAIRGNHTYYRVCAARLREIEERCVLEAL